MNTLCNVYNKHMHIVRIAIVYNTQKYCSHSHTPSYSHYKVRVVER